MHEYVSKDFYPFECALCSRKFADKRNMNKHIQQVHNKVFPFTCEICNKGFPQGKGFRDHVARQHPQLSDKVHNDVKVKTVTAIDLKRAIKVDVSASSEAPPQHHHQPIFNQQETLQQGQNDGQAGVTGPPTSVPDAVRMATTIANSHQLMSFESIHMSPPLDTRSIPYDARILHMDEQAVPLDARNMQLERNTHIQSSSVPLEGNPHLDNTGMHMNNRSIQMDSRNMPIDTKNMHLDSRNIPYGW